MNAGLKFFHSMVDRLGKGLTATILIVAILVAGGLYFYKEHQAAAVAKQFNKEFKAERERFDKDFKDFNDQFDKDFKARQNQFDKDFKARQNQFDKEFKKQH